MSRDYTDRKTLTFEQAEGLAPLPGQLKPKEVSPELRARLDAIFQISLREWDDPWLTIMRDHHVQRDHRMVNEFMPAVIGLQMQDIFQRGDYGRVFGFVQWVLRHDECPHELSESVAEALDACGAAYAVFDNDTIVPISSNQERATLEKAFLDVASNEFRGARAHLRRAAEALTSGLYADGVRESIHAVEAVARVLEGSAKTLDPALDKLEKSIRIHPALRAGFGKLYGFTSDEKGIRHALLDGGEAKVDETDALYMLGSCAAFVSYLIGKARAAGLLSN